MAKSKQKVGKNCEKSRQKTGEEISSSLSKVARASKVAFMKLNGLFINFIALSYVCTCVRGRVLRRAMCGFYKFLYRVEY